MSTFKKTKVVMLPTNEKAAMFISKKTPVIMQIGDNKVENEFWAGQHLYFLSDEEIKEGDWVLHRHTIYQVRINKGLYLTLEGLEHIDVRSDLCKKIIATTDSNLTIKTLLFVQGENKEIDVLLPQPSTSFIEKFVEEYNKGNVITEVMVEYESYHGMNTSIAEINAISGDNSMNWQGRGDNRDFRLKVNPKDNTITIRKVKDSWNREEVKVILEKAICEREQFLNKSGTLSYNFDRWIKENL